MQKLLLMSLLSLTLLGCEKSENYKAENKDNTGINVRDRDSSAKTPFNQSESEADRTITQKARQSLMGDTSLSTNAKNIKIITINGVVTLRGPISSLTERDIIERKVNSVPGVTKVENLLEVTHN